MIGFLVTIYAGLEHAFEADHLLAVNSLVTNRNKTKEAIKDGIFWGIGHTTTLFVVGIVMIGFKVGFSEKVFSYLEASVGLMLIFLGIYRMKKLVNFDTHSHTYWHSHDGLQPHSHTYSHKHWYVVSSHTHDASDSTSNNYKTALTVGIVHGLAGSGALVVLVLSQMKTAFEGLLYIVIFGLGSIIGMFLASGLFSIPYTKNFLKSSKLQLGLTLFSSLLCILYGLKVVWENLF
jgi:cytochrome c biogenesis protein CcdA